MGHTFFVAVTWHKRTAQNVGATMGILNPDVMSSLSPPNTRNAAPYVMAYDMPVASVV